MYRWPYISDAYIYTAVSGVGEQLSWPVPECLL